MVCTSSVVIRALTVGRLASSSAERPRAISRSVWKILKVTTEFRRSADSSARICLSTVRRTTSSVAAVTARTPSNSTARNFTLNETLVMMILAASVHYSTNL